MKMEKLLTRAKIDTIEGESRTISGCAIVFNKWSNDLGGFYERILPEAIT
jgi:phage head maturation protease